jgi:SAM-dependent methyltransferase
MGEKFSIREGVPVLLPPTIANSQILTEESFSEKWRRAPHYREKTNSHYIQWYLERYGFGSEKNLATQLKGARRILDAGTGHGRDAELFARNSNAEVFGLDISYGIHNAYRDFRDHERMHFVQADLAHPPFEFEFFDYISCDQVIHHTSDPQASFNALVDHLTPGGSIAVYTYKVKGPIREYADDYIRARTVNMTAEECMAFSEALTHLGKALSELRAEVEIPVDIPILDIKAGKIDVQRFIYWNMLKCYWNETMDWESNVITNFDWYHPKLAYRYKPEQFSAWFEEAGLQIQHMSVVESGTSIRGKKP